MTEISSAPDNADHYDVQRTRGSKSAEVNEDQEEGEGEREEEHGSENVNDMCEDVYKNLWITLSELAFDSHPIDAAIARWSYDKIFDAVIERVAPYRSHSDNSSV